jgi:predicted phage-related endonuclease
MITEKQRIERRKGVGGSDIHHLLNIEPYGCIRYLWYDKRGLEPDYPILAEGAIKRGNKMEDLIIDEYREVTGNKVRKVYKTLTHRSVDWARVHLDGEVVGHSNGPGILECKSTGRQMFMKIKQDGIPHSWILQMQYGMFITNRTWASIAVLWAEQWQFLTFDIERDDTIIDAIYKAGTGFWARVSNGPTPDRLDPKDKRCARCPYRTSCQGAALLNQVSENSGDVEFDDTLTPVVQDLVELETIATDVSGRIDEKKNKIKELIGDRPIVDCTGYRLHYRPIESKRVNTRRLKSEEPDVYERYATISVSRPFKKIAK